MLSYLKLQLHFLRCGIRESLRHGGDQSGPVPPPRLRHRVHGSTDPVGYLEVGRRAWNDLETLLRQSGRDSGACESILDFGCGSGRVIRNIDLAGRDAQRIVGVDIDRDAIRWCRRHLPGYTFQVGNPDPPLAWPDKTFDFLYAISVFTHLNERMQDAWLNEIRRVLKPDGVFIASLHGEHHRALTGRKFDLQEGFAFTEGTKGFLKKDGLPDFYQDTQHTRAYVDQHWSRYFQVESYVERGIGDHQDAVVLTQRRRAS